MKPSVLGLAALATLGLPAARPARADVVASNTISYDQNADVYYGQSFTVATPGAESDITFSYENTFKSTANPYASGTGFLLSSEYIGAPSGLSSSTAGFLGQTTAANNAYAFGSGLTLQSGHQYFFYDGSSSPAGTFLVGGEHYNGGNYFYTNTSSASDNFVTAAFSSDFLVTGTSVPSAAPEPSETATFSLFGLGLLGLILRARRQKKAA